VPLSVLAAEQIRSHLLAQVVYAPGIGPVLEELLSERGCEIVRLDRASGASLPADPVSFGDVQIALARRLPGPVTALAWVVERGGAARTVLNPDPADRPGADRIAAVYALADASLLGGGPAER
jgi:hypothetical protein